MEMDLAFKPGDVVQLNSGGPKMTVEAVQSDGIATSGSTLFRQIGGSIGVSIFGAIFANQLHSEVASRFPESAPHAGNPGAIRALPPEVRTLFEQAFAAALHPVFLMAAAVSLLAFALTWLIPALPLRESVAAVPGGSSRRRARDPAGLGLGHARMIARCLRRRPPVEPSTVE